MSAGMLAAVAVAYVVVAVGFWREDRPGMVLAFAAYAVANLGFIWDTLR